MNEDPENPNVSATRKTGDDLAGTAREAKAAFAERAGELRETARSSLHDAKAAVAGQSEAAKDQAAEELSRTAHGLETAAQELEGSPFQQELLREAADGLKQISRAVSGKSVGAMVEDISDFGRHNPLAFLGGAALAGFALARFARASAPDESRAGDYRPDTGGYRPGAYQGGRDTSGPAGSPYAPNAPYTASTATTTPQAPVTAGTGGSDDA